MLEQRRWSIILYGNYSDLDMNLDGVIGSSQTLISLK